MFVDHLFKQNFVYLMRKQVVKKHMIRKNRDLFQVFLLSKKVRGENRPHVGR